MIHNEKHPNPQVKKQAEEALCELEQIEATVEELFQKKSDKTQRYKKRSILIYMEDDVLRTSLKKFFESGGFKVDTAYGPKAVHDFLQNHGPSSPLIFDAGSFEIMETQLNGTTRSCVIISQKRTESKHLLKLSERASFWVASPIDPRAIVALVKSSM